MKTSRIGLKPVRRDELRTERVHDAYRSRWKFKEPTQCPQCGAVFREGRWTWGNAAAHAHEACCPACQRIHDGFPAGYVEIGGRFFREHREEIMQLARNCESREKPQHPLERIIGVQDTDAGVEVTTTSVHLARLIAEALQRACKGELDVQYSKQENMVRARWSRDD